ncbi:MAG: hypothetical protein M3237_09380 [Actinomycetota bacterium]|nr:hypothetical protein [Actinomycetota bacterium]
MRRSWLFSLIGGSLVGALIFAVILAGAQTGHGKRLAATAAQSAAVAGEDGEDGEAGEAGENGKREGHGPPPWAGKKGAKGSSDQSWQEAWRALSPAQRKQKMAALVKAHAQGMQKWGRCVAAAREDASKRAGCEKPVPPGLAKRLP